MNKHFRSKAAILKHYEDLTDVNDHTGAIKAIANYCGMQLMVERLEAIELLHEYTGYLPVNLAQIRGMISDEVFAKFNEMK